MKIITTTPLKTPDGENYKNGEKDLTLGHVVGTILIAQKGTDPLKQYQLTNKMFADEAELSLEELVLVKKLLTDNSIGQNPTFYPYIIGQALDMMDPKVQPPKPQA